MFGFVLFIILLILGLVVLALIRAVDEEAKLLVGITSGLLVLGALIVLALSSTIHVGSREVGVVTSLSKYESTQGPGWHVVSPWSSVQRFTTRIQTVELKGVPVTLAPESANGVGATAKVSARMRWHIADAIERNDKSARDLWLKYKNFDTVASQLVMPEAQVSARETLGDYTPGKARAGAYIREISTAFRDNLAEAVGDDGIVIDSVSITDVDLNEDVERRLREAVAAEGDLAKARVSTERAREEAKANRERQASLTREALIQQCLEITNRWDASRNGALPATWNCLGGSGAGLLVSAK